MVTAAFTGLVTACGNGTPPRTTFPRLHYEYLTPIGLNVATIDSELRVSPDSPPGDALPLAPVDVIDTLRRLGPERLKAFGTSGRAVLAITEVTLTRHGGHYEGSFAVELDIYRPDNSQAGYAAARVFRQIDNDDDDTRGILYDLIKNLMDALNVELEYQVRHRLREWIVAAPSAPEAPVQQQDLGKPGAAPPVMLAPPAPAPSAPSGPLMSPPPSSLGLPPAS
jgi:hypothetical protein